MSGESRDQALQHLIKAGSQLERGHYSDALRILEKAGQLTNEAQAPDILSIVLGTTGMAMRLAGRYEDALKMRERLLEGDSENTTYQSYVATTLNNLGALLSGMGRIDDAKERYEGALKMYERLLEGDPENVTYQSYVAMTLNNLGNLLLDMGRIDDARARYEGAIGIYTEPMQYMTIRQKARAVLGIIQLVSKSAEEATNKIKKSEYLREVWTTYNQHREFFTECGLDYEHGLARGAGLIAHIQYLMLNAEAEDNADKRTDEYARCVQEIKKIAETDDDEGLRELLLSVMHYFEGRRLINEAIKSDHLDKKLTEQAVEQFKLAKDRYEPANVCYLIYKVLLEIESVEVFDDAAVQRMDELLQNAIDSLPERLDDTVKSVFGEIKSLLKVGCVKVDPDVFIKLNRCIAKIDYYALGAHFTHIYEKIVAYLKEPFSPEVEYSNWTLKFKFDESEIKKVTGKLTIKAGANVLFSGPPGKIPDDIDYRPSVKNETITFTDGTGKTVTRPHVSYSDEIKCDDGHVKVYILEHDCKHHIISANFNIAIVQLKYHLYKEGYAIKVRYDERYLNKLRSILDAMKGEADLIVFPEFSIPFDYLSEFKQYSDANGIVIIVGSHYVTDTNLDEYGDIFDSEFGGFGENDLLKNISPVIIPSQENILHTEKVSGAKVERALFFGAGMKHGTLNRIFKLSDDVTCGVMICFDFVNDDLRQRITGACNIIVVPQSNPGTERFHKIGKIDIDNPRGAGNKAYIMASGIFTFGEDEKILGGDSAVILTLDKGSHEKREEGIIKSIDGVKEEFILLSLLNMGFFAARDTQQSQTPIITKLVHVFEEKDKPQDFLVLLQKIESCKDRNELKKILMDNESLIRDCSPLMHERTKNLENLSLDQIKDKCHAIVVE